MERFFLELLNRAICAGWLVPVILLLRVLLRKMPKWMRCLLWGMVAVRLIVPIQIESTVSLIPSAQTVSPDVMYAEKPEIHTGIGMLNAPVNEVILDHFSPKAEESVNPAQVLTAAASRVWLAGAVFLIFYAALSYVRLRMQVRTAVPAGRKNEFEQEDQVLEAGQTKPEDRGMQVRWTLSEDRETPVGGAEGKRQAAGRRRRVPVLESERVESPFVLGFIRPRIYLPTGVRETDRDYIVSHEMAHIHRKDHWIKPFGYLLLAVYWFHPLLWAAYIMLCRDIEYACDERVVKRYAVEERKAYSTALLSCSVRRFRIAACPVAFGEAGVRQRVKDVLHYKKPAFWVLLTAVLCLAVVAVCFLTNPKTDGGTNADGITQEPGGAAQGMGSGAPGADAMGSADGAMDFGDGSAAAAAVPAEGKYVFDHCIYLNLLSSYIPMEDQQINGYLDADGLLWNEFGEQTRFSFKKTDDLTVHTDTVPWTMFETEELKSRFGSLYGNDEMEAVLAQMETLPAQKRLWRPLEDGYCLLYVDSELWLMRTINDREGVWSIYALRPQNDALSDAVMKAAWDRAEETGAFGGVTRTGAAAEGVTGEVWATYPCISYAVLATEGSLDAADKKEETVTVYAQILATAFLCEQTGLTELGGSYGPAAITFLVNDDGSYTLSEYWTPRDGSYYEPDIRAKFPGESAEAALDGQRYIYDLVRDCYAKAISETGVVDTWSVVGGLFDRMQEDQDGLLKEDADALERMAAYPLTVRELIYYGDYTLRYIYSQFMGGGENGLRGELMVRVMHQMILEEVALRMPLTDGQAYFDALCEVTQNAYEDLVQSEGGEEEAGRFMQEYMPAQYLLLRMLGLRTADAEAPGEEDTYEYYLTREELLKDIDRGCLFRVDTAFRKSAADSSGGTVYPAPYVRMGTWPFYVHENNTINLEIAFSDLLRKPNETIFPGEEEISVEVISPDGQSVYRFERIGDEVTQDTSIQEQIPVTPGEWTLQVSFAYVCGEIPAHLKIAASYEEPSEEDREWLIEERLTHGDA